MRNSYDFDASTTYEMLEKKLQRCYDTFVEDELHVWCESTNTNQMRKLQEAIGLAKRLKENDYAVRAFSEADDRFRFHSWDTYVAGIDMYQFHSSYLLSPKRAKLFRKGREKVYTNMYKHDKKRLYHILDKYVDYWWC